MPATSELEHEIAEIAEIDADGRAYVRLRGSTKAVLARSVLDASVPLGDTPDALVGARVLVLYEGGDRSLPIIVGVVRDALQPPARPAELKLDLGSNRDVLIDGQRLLLDAQQEIQLRCGKSTIILTRDGRVLIRGAHLVSRSSGPNKIKGGSISLN
jgi:phage gp45-like